MRRVFIRCASRNTAKRRATWAACIIKTEGGFLAFESMADYLTWKGQK